MNRSLKRPPLHERIADDLRKELQSLDVGTKIPTEAELAARYDVSIPTLRIAMTIMVQEGLVHRKHGSGTYIAAKPTSVPVNLSVGKPVVGVPIRINNFAEPCEKEFWFRVNDLLLSGMDDRGIEYRLLPVRRRDGVFSRECESFIRSPEAGALLLTTTFPADILEAANERALPLLGFAEPPKNVTIFTGISYTNMVCQALQFFKRKGLERVALLAWNPEDQLLPGVESLDSLLVTRTFKNFIEEIGLVTKERWICSDLHPSNRGAGWSGLREIWSASSQKPNALLITDSKLFPGAMEAARELRIRVPGDLYILSHNNVPESLAFPPEIGRMEYLLSDWVEPILDAIQKIMRGETLEQKAIEVPGVIFEAEGEVRPGHNSYGEQASALNPL